jgi:hypothetical protein
MYNGENSQQTVDLEGAPMSGWLSIGASVGVAFLVAASARAQSAGELKPGDQAPAFKLEGSDGKTYSLEQFRGSKAVVLAWFPKAFTGG